MSDEAPETIIERRLDDVLRRLNAASDEARQKRAEATTAEAKVSEIESSARRMRLALLLDIDVPAWLVPSSTPGHSHLYVDLTTDQEALVEFLAAARKIGLIQPGYEQMAKDRGFCSLRLPWVRKAEQPKPDVEPVDPTDWAF